MSITIILRNKTYTLERETSVKRALELIDKSLQSHLVVRDGVLLTEDEMLRDGETIKLISVISGG